ncbi:hypothetical protein G7046_g7227 [Stylonectria norvegica]|nr:hypothetical protein G7046_g7227 [Stylonectria norvegica]
MTVQPLRTTEHQDKSEAHSQIEACCRSIDVALRRVGDRAALSPLVSQHYSFEARDPAATPHHRVGGGNWGRSHRLLARDRGRRHPWASIRLVVASSLAVWTYHFFLHSSQGHTVSPGPLVCSAPSTFLPFSPPPRMPGASCLRMLLDMASQILGTSAVDPRPTRYYFAYGSNLHLKQMKRRCPNSKLIGWARLVDHRWQINERGYANVVEAAGQWVDGLVYEIDAKDEARLDINEGVSKNAYTKRHMPVLLRRAQSALYRRPTSWIVDQGGPAKVCRQAKQGGQKPVEYPQHWEQDVLVYISLNYVQDGKPKNEYVSRINLGLADAKVLGLENDYITNCIRPFIPEPPKKPRVATTAGGNPVQANGKGKQPIRGTKRTAPPRTDETSPARKTQGLAQLSEMAIQQIPTTDSLRQTVVGQRRAQSDVGAPPPLPPRPARRMCSIPLIVVEETHIFSRLA